MYPNLIASAIYRPIILRSEFPDLQGFSRTNLLYIRRWYLFYQSESEIVPQVVAQLETSPVYEEICQIPWGHNREIISKCQNLSEALYYVQQTIEHNWSRAVLVHQIESKLYEREGKALSNFAQTLPQPQSDLAQQTLKDPYIFDFLHLTKGHTERDLDNALVGHIMKLLLELGMVSAIHYSHGGLRQTMSTHIIFEKTR